MSGNGMDINKVWFSGETWIDQDCESAFAVRGDRPLFGGNKEMAD